MKLSDIILENKKQELTEKPMGFLKTMGNKVASAFGSGQAQGRLDTGKEANALRKEFDVFLGKTGQNPTGDLVLQFLTQKGYPTKSAQNFIAASKPQAAQASPEQPAASQTQQPTQPAAQPQADKAAVAAKVKANVGRSQAATKGSNFGQPVEQPKAQPGAAAFGQMAQQLTKPAPEQPAQQPSVQQPAAPVGRVQGGGKVAGQLSQTPGAIRKRQNRAVKKRTAHPADDNPNIQLGNESFEYTFESKLNFYLLKEEVLSSKQLDQIFLAAAQDKAKGGNAASSGAAGTPSKSAAGAQQGDQTGAPLSQPNQPSADTKQGSAFLKHAAAAYDGMRGASYGATKIGGDSAGKELKDTSGRVPPEIIGQLNKLTNKQRAELRKELDKA
jgi:hypothetical protein